MAIREYVGARYVPRFLGLYNASQVYEALDVVDNGQGTSYISKIPTPAGTPLTNTTYWAIYGASSGAIINLQNQIGDLSSLHTSDKTNLVNAINENTDSITTITDAFINVKNYGALGDGLTDDTAAIQSALDTGKNVLFPDGIYLVSNTLNYSGRVLFGSGTIKSTVALEKVVSCANGTSLDVAGLTIDGNDKSAVMLYISNYESVHVHDSIFENSENATLVNVRGCAGVAVFDTNISEIERCIIRNINRTQTSPGTISSVGVESCADLSFIHDNIIANVKCSAQQNDCDAIYVVGKGVGILGLGSGVAIVENNNLSDATGRFIKSQCALTYAINNDMTIATDFTLTDAFICVDIQAGSGVIENNRIDLKNTYNRNYSFITRLQVTGDNHSPAIKVSNNVIKGVVNASIQVRAIMRVDDVIGGNANIDVNNNVELIEFEDVIDYSSNNVSIGTVKITNNRLQTIHFASAIGIGNLSGPDFIIENNDCRKTGTKTSFSGYTNPFTGLIMRNNRDIEPVTNTGLDWNTLTNCDFVHYKGELIANKPFGGTGYIHLVKNDHRYSIVYLDATAPQPVYQGHF